MLNRLIYEQFNKMKPFICSGIGIFDMNGDIIASNDDKIREIDDDLMNRMKSAGGYTEVDGKGYEWVSVNGLRVCLISFDINSYKFQKEIINLVKLNIETVLEAEQNIFSKRNFYRDIMIGNIHEDKISSLCFDYNIPVSQEGYVLIVEYGHGKRENSVENILQNFFDNANIVYIDETHTVIIYDFEDYDTNEKIVKAVKGLVDEIRLETMVPVNVGIGTKARDIFQLKDSYDKAFMALSAGKIFYTDEFVYDYNSLGIARLVYSLPVNVCRQFLNDVLPGEAIEFFSDKEILNTVKMFFQSNLNMSVAARELYVHRNTLVYRLDKINKLTGYNLANFDDAVIIKTALMIKDYLDRYVSVKGGNTDDKIC